MLSIKRQRRADLYLDIIEGFLNVAIGFLQHLDDCYDRKNMKILLAPKFCPPAHGEGNTSGKDGISRYLLSDSSALGLFGLR